VPLQCCHHGTLLLWLTELRSFHAENSVAGLGAIPFIVHPIDESVHAVMNASLRPAIKKFLCGPGLSSMLATYCLRSFITLLQSPTYTGTGGIRGTCNALQAREALQAWRFARTARRSVQSRSEEPHAQAPCTEAGFICCSHGHAAQRHNNWSGTSD
jgi:hypothetical protein